MKEVLNSTFPVNEGMGDNFGTDVPASYTIATATFYRLRPQPRRWPSGAELLALGPDL